MDLERRKVVVVLIWFSIYQIAGGNDRIFMLPNLPPITNYIGNLTVFPRHGATADVRIIDLELNQTLAECNLPGNGNFQLGKADCSLPPFKNGIALVTDVDVIVIARLDDNSLRLPAVDQMDRQYAITSGTLDERIDSLKRLFVYPSRQNMSVDICQNLSQRNASTSESKTSHYLRNCSNKLLNNYEGASIDSDYTVQEIYLDSTDPFGILELHNVINDSSIFITSIFSLSNYKNNIENKSKSKKTKYPESLVEFISNNVTESYLKNLLVETTGFIEADNANSSSLGRKNGIGKLYPYNKTSRGKDISKTAMFLTTEPTNKSKLKIRTQSTPQIVNNRNTSNSTSEFTQISEMTTLSTDTMEVNTAIGNTKSPAIDNIQHVYRYKSVMHKTEVDDRKDLLAIVISLCSALFTVVVVIVICLIMDLFSRRKKIRHKRIRPY